MFLLKHRRNIQSHGAESPTVKFTEIYWVLIGTCQTCGNASQVSSVSILRSYMNRIEGLVSWFFSISFRLLHSYSIFLQTINSWIINNNYSLFWLTDTPWVCKTIEGILQATAFQCAVGLYTDIYSVSIRKAYQFYIETYYPFLLPFKQSWVWFFDSFRELV